MHLSLRTQVSRTSVLTTRVQANKSTLSSEEVHLKSYESCLPLLSTLFTPVTQQLTISFDLHLL